MIQVQSERDWTEMCFKKLSLSSASPKDFLWIEAKISGEFDFSQTEVGRVKPGARSRTRASRKSSV